MYEKNKGFESNVDPEVYSTASEFNETTPSVQNSHPYEPSIPESEFIEVSITDFEQRIEPDVDLSDWPDPQEIPTTLLPVEPFDESLLPATLRPWVKDIAERMQCPIDFPAIGAIIALSSVIGRKVCIQPKRKDDWTVVPNLWGAVIGRPGVMKSPALSEVMKPLSRLSLRANEKHSEEMLEYKTAQTLAELTGKRDIKQAQAEIKKGNVAEAERIIREAELKNDARPPALRRYQVTDATVESLGEILIENSWGLLVYRDELHGLLRSLDKDGQEGARAFYLQGYDGNQSYTFDRIMRGRNLHIPAVCFSILGGIQPGKIMAYIHEAVKGGVGDDGLLQRFGLLVWPDVTNAWVNVDEWPDSDAKRLAFETFERLDKIEPNTDAESGETTPIIVHFSSEAQDIFDHWRNGFEKDLRSSDHHPAMESHLSKYRKLVPALALIISLADDEREVSASSIISALAWIEYLESHAARVYAAGMKPPTDGARALLRKIRSGDVKNGFKPADVYLKGWSHLASTEEAHAAIKTLLDAYYLKDVDPNPNRKYGRPSITYLINPKAMSN